LYKKTAAIDCEPTITEPSICAIAQGAKEIMCGEEAYRYDPASYLLTAVEVPISAQILQASEDEPFLGVVLNLDPTRVSSVMVEAGYPGSPEDSSVRGIGVGEFDVSLLDALVRLVRVSESPEDASQLAPLIRREIIYRLLSGDQGERLRQVAVLGNRQHRIVEAIEHIRDGFDQKLEIEEIAKKFGMSTSSFHRHFKDVTAMTPLQYQKKLRLQEARRLMLADDFDASTAGFEVGYNDASHFSREYKRMFGQPPMTDVQELRNSERSA
jgi:AraC-like DNA-binding protein